MPQDFLTSIRRPPTGPAQELSDVNSKLHLVSIFLLRAFLRFQHELAALISRPLSSRIGNANVEISPDVGARHAPPDGVWEARQGDAEGAAQGLASPRPCERCPPPAPACAAARPTSAYCPGPWTQTRTAGSALSSRWARTAPPRRCGGAAGPATPAADPSS